MRMCSAECPGSPMNANQCSTIRSLLWHSTSHDRSPLRRQDLGDTLLLCCPLQGIRAAAADTSDTTRKAKPRTQSELGLSRVCLCLWTTVADASHSFCPKLHPDINEKCRAPRPRPLPVVVEGHATRVAADTVYPGLLPLDREATNWNQQSMFS